MHFVYFPLKLKIVALDHLLHGNKQTYNMEKKSVVLGIVGKYTSPSLG